MDNGTILAAATGVVAPARPAGPAAERGSNPGRRVPPTPGGAPPDSAAAVAERMQHLFRAARWEEFDTGVESRFARDVAELVCCHPRASVQALRELVLVGPVADEAAWEALRWLGCLGDPGSRTDRLELLMDALRSPSYRARDGAALGLAAMDDPHAIPALERAIEVERIPELRADFLQVLEQLVGTEPCPGS